MPALRLSMHGFLDEAVLERPGYPRILKRKQFTLVSSWMRLSSLVFGLYKKLLFRWKSNYGIELSY